MEESRAGMWTWLLQRLTAIYIVFALAIHFYVHHFTFKAAADTAAGMPGGRFYSAQAVATRLSEGGLGWGLFYLLFVFCVAYHGFFGVLKVIEDHVSNKKAIAVMHVLAWLCVAGTMVAGLLVYRILVDQPYFGVATAGGKQ